MTTEEYTITLRNESFTLTRDQLFFDAPNYFTILFLTGPFLESTSNKRQVVLHRDPELFRIIEAYLSGYEIFPLPDMVSGWMSRGAVGKNLLADARFYGLDGLVEMLEVEFGNVKGSLGSLSSSSPRKEEWRI